MIFNPDASKKPQEIVFSRKENATNHRTIYFNNVPVRWENIQKHLDLLLDPKLNFLDRINENTIIGYYRRQCYKKNELAVTKFFSAGNI